MSATKDYAMQQRIAVRPLTQHDHKGYQRDELTRENCSACVLNGYHSAPRYGGDGRPNYAGWLRVYIQAGRSIKYAAIVTELAEAKEGNLAYYNAILDDARHYGCPNRHGQYDAQRWPHENLCPLCEAVKNAE